MSNLTQNKPEGYPYEDADFYPKYQEVCQICGITSFAHRHKAGSMPKDFEHLPEVSKTKKRASEIDIPKWSERLQKAYDRGYADARKEVMMDRIDRLKLYEVIENIYLSGWYNNDKGVLRQYMSDIINILATLREEESK
jgi:hypothetical protein